VLDKAKEKLAEIKNDLAEGESIGAAGSQGATRREQGEIDSVESEDETPKEKATGVLPVPPARIH
jgi:hypothetical protein